VPGTVRLFAARAAKAVAAMLFRLALKIQAAALAVRVSTAATVVKAVAAL
jgi:hypothetical protein